MDWSEALRKAAVIADATGHITLAQFNELILPAAVAEDIESLISAVVAGAVAALRAAQRQKGRANARPSASPKLFGMKTPRWVGQHYSRFAGLE